MTRDDPTPGCATPSATLRSVRPAQVEIEAAAPARRPTVAQISRSDRGVGADEDTPDLSKPSGFPGSSGLPTLPASSGGPVRSLQQTAPQDPVVVHHPSEGRCSARRAGRSRKPDCCSGTRPTGTCRSGAADRSRSCRRLLIAEVESVRADRINGAPVDVPLGVRSSAPSVL